MLNIYIRFKENPEIFSFGVVHGVGDTIRADVVSVGAGYTFEGWYVHGVQTQPMMSETTFEIYIENEGVLNVLIDFFGGSDTTIYACNEEDGVTTYTVYVYAEWEYPIPCSVTPYAPNGKYTEGTVLTISADTPIDAIVFQGWYVNYTETEDFGVFFRRIGQIAG